MYCSIKHVADLTRQGNIDLHSDLQLKVRAGLNRTVVFNKSETMERKLRTGNI